ncbi:MAG: adenylosuccinate lyase [Flavobacteriales bacterium]
MNELTAVSPVDGRYRGKSVQLASYLSEWGLMKYRLKVEVEYFIALFHYLELGKEAGSELNEEALRAIYQDFSEADAAAIKATERVTNHDVKAVEYFLKSKFDGLGLATVEEFVHFGLTSQDVNNTAIPLSLMDATNEVLLPMLEKIRQILVLQAREWKTIPMLARTHGQPASPVTLGKEWAVFVNRLDEQLIQLRSIRYAAKFGGATGQFNAHVAAYPDRDWMLFGNQFVEHVLGLKRSKITTQIEHYDHLAAWCDAVRRIHVILMDFSKDVWAYISMDYFKQKIKAGEVGSSAMPHKVNPIDFENAEGNWGVANALLNHFSEKLPVSRLQRDLTDSTVLRNLGVPLGHSLIALQSLEKGLNKLLLNRAKIDLDLAENWAVVAEAIQTILRREGFPKPYEALKSLTRQNEEINRETIARFIDELEIQESVKIELRQLSPETYIGLSTELVDSLKDH